MGKVAWVESVDVVDWDQQVKAFEAAVSEFGRIDYVYPIAGIGERPWTPHHKGPKDAFVKPDLTVVDIDVKGVLYSVSLALQQFRRQEPDKNGFRGKGNAASCFPIWSEKSDSSCDPVGLVASVCGFYCAPTLPIYTASKQ